MDKSYKYFLLRQLIKGVYSKFSFKNKTDLTDFYYLILKQAQCRGWVINRAAQISWSNYDISTTLELIETQFNFIFSNKTINLKFDCYHNRVEINRNEKYVIACYAELSILQLFGFGLQSIVQNTLGNQTFEFIILNSN